MNAHSIDEVIAFQIGQMRALFFVGRMRANSVRHDHHEAAIIHVQPIASTNKLIRGVSRERAIGFSTKVRLVKRA